MENDFFVKKYIVFVLPILLLWASCQTAPSEDYYLIGGKTMGTTYSVKYKGDAPDRLNAELDSLFKAVNAAVSVYEKEALISQFNRDSSASFEVGAESPANQHFRLNFERAKAVHKESGGLFDPTVMPLVNYWGFGSKGRKAVTEADSIAIKSMLESVGFGLLSWASDGNGKQIIQKKHPRTQLDFGAIAKGYAVDLAANLLISKGCGDYMVEIGGEVVTKGLSPNDLPWAIGINTPKEDARVDDFEAIVALSGKGMATSGNYRNFHEVDGKKYAHTISPETGYPVLSNLLSATIIADDCMTADAFATACMAGGLDKALALVEAREDLFGYFIYSDENGQMKVQYSSGFERFLRK